VKSERAFGVLPRRFHVAHDLNCTKKDFHGRPQALSSDMVWNKYEIGQQMTALKHSNCLYIQ